jgi:hypothetical protein
LVLEEQSHGVPDPFIIIDQQYLRTFTLDPQIQSVPLFRPGLPVFPAAKASVKFASAVPSDLNADERNEINNLRTNDHRFEVTGDRQFEDLQKVSLKIFKIERTADTMMNDFLRLLERREVGEM